MTRTPDASVIERAQSSVNASIIDQLKKAGVDLVASLPDNAIARLIKDIDGDDTFLHVPVNREESAVGLCAGAYLGGRAPVALMGASGLVTAFMRSRK